MGRYGLLSFLVACACVAAGAAALEGDAIEAVFARHRILADGSDASQGQGGGSGDNAVSTGEAAGAVAAFAGPPQGSRDAAIQTFQDGFADFDNKTTIDGVKIFDYKGNEVSSAEIGVGAVVNVMLGAACFIGFGILRKYNKVYKARLCSPSTSVKPPKLPEGGVLQVISWILPLMRMSDESLLSSAGLDALMYSRFLMMCVQFFIPVAVLSIGILLPIHWTSTAAPDGGKSYRCPHGRNERTTEVDDLLRSTLANMCQNDPLMWFHLVYTYLVLLWAMWLLNKHYIAYASLKHYYIGMPQKFNPWVEKYLAEHVHADHAVKERSPSQNQIRKQKSASSESERERNAESTKDKQLHTVTSGALLQDVDVKGVSLKASVSRSPELQVMTPDEERKPRGHRRQRSLGEVVFNLATWRNVAEAWINPDKLIDNRGKEPSQLKSLHNELSMKTTGSSTRNVEEDEGLLMGEGGERDPACVEVTLGESIASAQSERAKTGEPSSSGPKHAWPMANRRQHAGNAGGAGGGVDEEKRGEGPAGRHVELELSGMPSLKDLVREEAPEDELVHTPSLAAIKWWEVYNVATSQKEIEQEVMARPSVRHIKSVNTNFAGDLVSVNAGQYAVLVTDIPTDEGDLDTIRRSVSRTSDREGAEDDEDAIKIDPADDICTEVFQNIFPRSFKHIVPVKDFRAVTKLLLRWDNAAKKLEVHEALLRVHGIRRFVRPGFLGLFGPKMESIPYLQGQVNGLANKIKEARKAIKAKRAEPASFAIFDNQVDAAIAAQSVLLPFDGTKFVTHKAPSPDNINWLTLFQTGKSRLIRRIIVIPFIALLIVFPSGIFFSALAILNTEVCTENTQLYWPAYCELTQGENSTLFGRLISRLIVGWLPTILLSVWQNVVVIRTLYAVALCECMSVSLDGLDRRVTALYFYWSFLNVFLGSVFGSGLVQFFATFLTLDNVFDVLEVLGTALNKSATFLTAYALTRALLLVPMKLVFPHPQVLMFFLKKLCSVMCCKGCGITRRDRFEGWQPKSCMYGREAGISMLMCLIGVCYALSSPITVAVVAFYFMGIFVVFRHHLLYVYSRAYESGGELWPVLFDRFVVMLVSLAFFVSVQLLTREAFAQAIILIVTVPPVLYRYHRVLSKRYKNITKVVPLDIAFRQPRGVVVPPSMFIPSELRFQSAGWHPEQGKAWQGYGVPRYL